MKDRLLVTEDYLRRTEGFYSPKLEGGVYSPELAKYARWGIWLERGLGSLLVFCVALSIYAWFLQ